MPPTHPARAKRRQGQRLFLMLELDFDEDEKVRRLVRYGKDARACRDLLVAMWRYCKKNTTDGHVPLEELGLLVYPDSPRIGRRDADRLVEVGLAERTPEGYFFPSFLKRNKSRAQIEAEQAVASEEGSEAGRRGNHVKWHENRGIVSPDCEYCPSGEDRVTPMIPLGSPREKESGSDRTENREQRTENKPNYRPVEEEGSTSVTGGESPPPDHCPQHPSSWPDPCRACGAAKRTRTRWDRDHAAELAKLRQNCRRCHGSGLLENEAGDPIGRCDHQPTNQARTT